mmetsp:Transcript_8285/g.20914  ORF Transcript_8285/g.20914 Transcript_8285/m.20914 type:complete len:207 (-) Transcript_8285:592-1212(-)
MLRRLRHVELVPLPLGCQLVPRHEPKVDAQDGARQEQQHERVHEVQSDDHQLHAQSAQVEKLEDERRVSGSAHDGDEHQTRAHQDEFSVVKQSYAVRHPPAVVVVTPDGPGVLPCHVRSLRQRLLLLRLLSLHVHEARVLLPSLRRSELARVAQRAVRHASQCGDVEPANETGNDHLCNLAQVEEGARQRHLEQHHAERANDRARG